MFTKVYNEQFRKWYTANVAVLQNGGLILYPTDTIWGGCDATNEEAVAKIYALKQRPDKSMLVLVADERQLNQYITLPTRK